LRARELEMERAQQAERLLVEFADLLRASLDCTRRHTVPLEDELAIARAYLEIEGAPGRSAALQARRLRRAARLAETSGRAAPARAEQRQARGGGAGGGRGGAG